MTSPTFLATQQHEPHNKNNMGFTSSINSFLTSYYPVNPASTFMIYHRVEEI